MEVETPKKATIDGNSDFANSQKLVQLFEVWNLLHTLSCSFYWSATRPTVQNKTRWNWIRSCVVKSICWFWLFLDLRLLFHSNSLVPGPTPNKGAASVKCHHKCMFKACYVRKWGLICTVKIILGDSTHRMQLSFSLHEKRNGGVQRLSPGQCDWISHGRTHSWKM